MTARFRAKVALALVVSSLALGTACASLAGLTGGSEERRPDATPDVSILFDAGLSDASHPHDATVDHHVVAEASHDAGKRDAHKVDAGHEPDASDAGASDVVDVQLFTFDAGDTSAPCVPIPIEAGPPVACPAVEAGVCAPRASDAGFTWRPPNRSLGACTESQLGEFVTACLSASAPPGSCEGYIQDAGGESCFRCLVSDISADSYGPIVQSSDILFVNSGGCIALIEPCNVACASVVQESTACGVEACVSTCGRDSGATPTQAEDCAMAATTCACKGLSTASTLCDDILFNDPAVSGCIDNAAGFAGLVLTFGNLFCGNGTLSPD